MLQVLACPSRMLGWGTKWKNGEEKLTQLPAIKVLEIV